MRAPRTSCWWLLLALLGAAPTSLADDDVVEAHHDLDDEPEPAPRRTRARQFDYSRFSDGPRRVPEARGASLARAEALGLGTRECASQLLHGRPDPRWIEAARGSMPAHLDWPVELGRFGRGFGYVRRTRPDLAHNGVDIVAEEGRVVRAVADGVVAYSDNGVRGFGNLVILVHPDGLVSVYAHNYRTTVPPGWQVRRGERIAFVGNTGISRGPHLHFELRRDGRPIDPLPHFEGRPWLEAYRAWSAARSAGTLEPPADHLRATLPPDRPARAGTARPSARAAAPLAGDVAHVTRLLARGATPSELEEVEGAVFRNLLWPVRGGRPPVVEGRGVNIPADEGDAVRVVADGLVLYVGEGLRGLGRAVVVLHRNGWVSLYGSNAETHVEVGQQVRRGEWIARVGMSGGGAPHLHFQLRDAGEVVDPIPLFVQTPH